ncbi:MAG: hypothetical protein ACI9LN_003636, partial [Saprospiraceae bacterium]
SLKGSLIFCYKIVNWGDFTGFYLIQNQKKIGYSEFKLKKLEHKV